MALNINQFSQTTVQGQLDLSNGVPGGVISGIVDAAQSGSLVAGQAVTMTTTSGGVPNFIAAAANGSPVWGFVVRNLKDNNTAIIAGARIEVATTGAVMFMTSGAAITRNASVIIDATNILVNPTDGITPSVGFALDTATASGQLIRVWIEKAALTSYTTKLYTVTATLAQINAGLVLLPGITGKKITISNYIARVSGNFATGTAVILEDTNGTPVVVTTLAEAGLTTGAILLPSSSNTTLGAGFAAALTAGAGLQVVNSGSAQTGGTSITFTLTYQQN